MTYNFPYLKDSAFLKTIDNLKIKEQFVKIIVLSFDEMPIQQIQGIVTGGNFSLNGDSAMRRTANLTLLVDDFENNITNLRSILSMNKKIEILIGFTNTTNQYTNFPILWFPQGVYLIISPSISNSQSGISISLTLHDKMALLNGECGGTLPASTIFNEMEFTNQDGEIQIAYPTIYQIIQELVNHFGGEQLGKIIISDIDSKIKKVMRWTDSVPLYMYEGINQDKEQTFFSTDYNEIISYKQKNQNGSITEFNYGDDIGYILTDFIYPGDLIGNAGQTVVSVLDQIKNTLGNYEYFYDIDGNFRFQEIKNYLNTSYSTFLLNELNMDNYLSDFSNTGTVYTFEDAEIIQSFSNAPQYQQIKNDFVVWGQKESKDGTLVPIRYHLAIDKKPFIGNSYKIFFYTDPDDNVKKAKKPLEFNSIEEFPQKGQAEIYYYDNNNQIIYKWNPELKEYEETSYQLEEVITTDYRNELYMEGVSNEPYGLSSNYYYTELKNEWPKIYDIQNQCFFEDTLNHPSDINFFLDFIDTTASNLTEFNISNIGRRTVTIVDDKINCLFEPDNPDIVLIEKDSENAIEQKQNCILRKQKYIEVPSEIYEMLSTGGVLRSAYDQIKKELYNYTSYNEQVSLTTLPIYYLQPNTRITVRDPQSGIFGDYIIKTISLPLDINGTMTISCIKALERI